VEGTVEIKVKQGCIDDFILVCEIDNLVVSDFFDFGFIRRLIFYDTD
jgi:hypothetical protein